MEDKQIAISYYNTHICNSKVCKDCPGRLSVPKHSQIPNYIGCYYPKIIFVLPVLNLKKKSKTNTYEQINALCELFKEAYGYDLLETCMITWAVRCPDFEHKDYSIDYCDKILYQILCNNHQKYTVFVGKWLSNIFNIFICLINNACVNGGTSSL